MVLEKKTSMVSALIIANVILVVTIVGILWILVLDYRAESTAADKSLTSNSMQATSEENAATKAEVKARLSEDKRTTEALAKKLEVTETNAQLLAKEKKRLPLNTTAIDQQTLAFQLEREKKRVYDLVVAQAKADLENKRLINQLRAQLQTQNRLVQQAKIENQQKVKSSSSSGSAAQQLIAAIEPDVASASQADREYIQALKGDFKAFIISETQKRALTNVGTKKVDYFNRVVMAKNTSDANSGKITKQVNHLLDDLEKKKEKKQLEKVNAYLRSLNPLAQQRKSESRFITVKSGDTMSEISARAYGDWRLYRKIFNANPHILSNPDLIYPGQVLRVPL